MSDEGYRLVCADRAALVEAQPVEPDAVRTRPALKAAGATLVRISFDAGQSMREHVAAVPILLQVIDGEVSVDVGEARETLRAGGIIHIDARVPHAVNAVTPAQALLVLLEGSPARPQRAPRDTAAASAPGGRRELGLSSAADADGPPEIDVRTIPRGLRHGAVLGALERVHEGRAMVLDAPHDPVPLLGEIEERSPGRFRVEYLERGPKTWRLQLTATRPA